MIMNSKNLLEETYDVAVVGAGHAGCEAALACARLGLETIIFTVSVDSIALMPCNPNTNPRVRQFIRCVHRRIRQITAWRCGIHYRIRSI